MTKSIIILMIALSLFIMSGIAQASSTLYSSISGISTRSEAINVLSRSFSRPLWGVTLSDVDVLFARGSFQSSSTATNMVIGGSGFYMIRFVDPDTTTFFENFSQLTEIPAYYATRVGSNISQLYGPFPLTPQLSPTTPTTATPIPGAVWLLGSGLAGVVAMKRRKKK